MKKLLIFGAFWAFLAACAPVKYVPVEGRTEIIYKDTTIFRTDTVKVDVPVEVVKEVVPAFDTLHMETSLAFADAWVDTTTSTLRGGIENKRTAISKPIETKERLVYRDSVVTKEVPVPVEVVKEVTRVPWIVKVLAWIGGLALLYAVFRLLKWYFLRRVV